MVRWQGPFANREGASRQGQGVVVPVSIYQPDGLPIDPRRLLGGPVLRTCRSRTRDANQRREDHKASHKPHALALRVAHRSSIACDRLDCLASFAATSELEGWPKDMR